MNYVNRTLFAALCVFYSSINGNQENPLMDDAQREQRVLVALQNLSLTNFAEETNFHKRFDPSTMTRYDLSSLITTTFAEYAKKRFAGNVVFEDKRAELFAALADQCKKS
jgi:hypothetical protein